MPSATRRSCCCYTGRVLLLRRGQYGLGCRDDGYMPLERALGHVEGIGWWSENGEVKGSR
jgi:hypothetical protein